MKTYLFVMAWFAGLIINISILAAIIYVVHHFVVKYW